MATINGTSGDNVLLDNMLEDDQINGLAGNDSIYVTSGRDVVDGGADFDALFIDYSTESFAVQNFGENGFDNAAGNSPTSVRFSNVERVDIRTGSGEDTIRTFFRPDPNADAIVSGNDFIQTGAGNDRAAGGDGNDALRGGDGNDVLDGDGTLFGKFGASRTIGEVTFSGDDSLSGEAGNDMLYGGAGSDILNGGIGDDELYGDLSAFRVTDFGNGASTRIEATTGNDLTSGDDVLNGGDGNDLLVGNAGNDTITGGIGNDRARTTLTSDGADSVDLGSGSDVVEVSANANSEVSTAVRITFTSAEVGNGNALDGGNNANEDGGLAVRLQSENYADGVVGPLSRYDDEGITFVASSTGVKFDVRDLPSGVARGDQFEVVVLGTSGADTLTAVQNTRPYYFNAGMGDDSITGGTANDFLVGGAGTDTLDGAGANDSYIGGGGNDVINDTGGGVDTIAAFNITTDGADSVNLGGEIDVFNVAATAPTNVRVTFTSAEIGNGAALDGGNNPNEDGGLAVRLQAEDAGGALPAGGNVTRAEDEGLILVGGAGVTFDVRDLPTGVGRGEAFEVVVLGTSAGDTLSAVQAARPYYFNGGMGDDVITDGTANDFLVGGAGNDTLTASVGNDSFIGGGGADIITGGADDDRIAAFNVLTDGADSVDLGVGSDVFNVGTNVGATTNVRLTFTSADVGNGAALDGNNAANEDGGLAVRLQAEDAGGALTGPVTRVDDEGITFVAGAGVTFDVRDLPSGAARGELFQTVSLGTAGADAFVLGSLTDYINAGAGDDNIQAGLGDDFLVGGTGNDRLDGEGGIDSLLGGAGDDDLFGGDGGDNLNGGAGADKLYGQADNDVLAGGDDDDNLLGGDGQDNLSGDAGRDILYGEGDDDALSGGIGNDDLNGGLGADTLFGDAGNDRLFGGDGADTLNGGRGRDILFGNAGSDVFQFSDLMDSTLQASTRDLVSDFMQGLDLLDVAGIDANAGLGGNQAFSFLGAGAFSGNAAELRFFQSGATTIFEGDVNGDAVADFQVQITGNVTLIANDFVL